MLMSAIRRPLDAALPGPIMRQEVLEGATFGSGIFGMGVVVVEPGAVRQDQITLHLVKREGATGINLGEVILFLVLLQTRHAEPARILMWVFASIVPPTFEIAGQVGSYQLHRFFDRIDHLEIFSRDPVFRFYPEQMHALLHPMPSKLYAAGEPRGS